MMHTISSHASENRMTPSAVAACMAPLLLRPLLAGECELEDDFDINGDSSAQLLAAANAANNAQAIITTLLEEYDDIFDVSHFFSLVTRIDDSCFFFSSSIFYASISILNCVLVIHTGINHEEYIAVILC